MPGFELILDILILGLLAATVFFAARLSMQLDVFRKGREDFEKILRDISRAVASAESAIHGMKSVAQEEGVGLQKIIDRGRSLSDELQLIHDAGDALAERLEKLAGRTRAVAEELDEARLSSVGQLQATRGMSATPAAPATAIPDRPFAIRDHDLERDQVDDDAESGAEDRFLSKAERDLQAALLKSRQTRS